MWLLQMWIATFRLRTTYSGHPVLPGCTNKESCRSRDLFSHPLCQVLLRACKRPVTKPFFGSMGRKYLSSAVDPVNRIALSTGFQVNVAKSASARLADLCRGESKNLNRWRVLSRPHRLKKISSMQSQRRDPHLHWPHRQTRDYNSLLEVLFTTITNHNLPSIWTAFCFGFFFRRCDSSPPPMGLLDFHYENRLKDRQNARLPS